MTERGRGAETQRSDDLRYTVPHKQNLHLDIMLGNLRGFSNYLFLNDGKGRFAKPVLFGPSEDDTQTAAVVDLDGDKHLDVVIGNMNGPDRVFFGDGIGAFGRSTSFGPERGATRAMQWETWTATVPRMWLLAMRRSMRYCGGGWIDCANARYIWPASVRIPVTR